MNNTNSLRASTPIDFTQVRLTDAFWAPRQQLVRERTLPHIYRQFEETGHLDVLNRQWHFDGATHLPYVLWDSDIAKWLESAGNALATQPDPALERQVDHLIELLTCLQHSDGYLNTYYTFVEPGQRWSNLRDWHELYCAGHLIEAGVAHAQATGKRTLLTIACRYADYIATVFGVGEGQRRGYCGHPEIELALIRLYRLTQETRYLELSRYFIEERGRHPHYFDQEAEARGESPQDFWAGTYEYNQSHAQVRNQPQVVGHAVRAMYLYCALADLAVELGDPSLKATCERLWQHLTATRLYITGGIGSSSQNEGFTADYDLPAFQAYAETCAAIGLVMWSHRMLQVDVDSRYADVLERALYNGLLSGLGLDGTSFFYANPLASNGTHHRKGWFKCACCPLNLARFLLSLGQYCSGVNDKNIFIHLYAQGSITAHIGDQPFTIHQMTRYPWDGTVQFSFDTMHPVECGINLRLPGWCRRAQLRVNDQTIEIDPLLQKGYIHLYRIWDAEDTVILELPMPVERMIAHSHVTTAKGSVALQRGPLVYCIESVDNGAALDECMLPATATIQARFWPDLLGGVVTLETVAERQIDQPGILYSRWPPQYKSQSLRAIPYHVWNNRTAGEMRVWIRSC